MRLKIFTAVMLLALLGCEQNTPESRLEAAGDTLAATEDNLEYIEQSIEQHEQALVDLRKRRREVRERVLTLEERVEARATDVALFRAVQSALLENEALRQRAVSVDAESGVIVLNGLVASEQEETLAVQIAGGVPGVGKVTSRMEIDADTPPSK
jgi:osmotically-inducible protein OsmY